MLLSSFGATPLPHYDSFIVSIISFYIDIIFNFVVSDATFNATIQETIRKLPVILLL